MLSSTKITRPPQGSTGSTHTQTWRDVLPVHPAAELFPLMGADELRELGEDIKANGLKSPIVLWSPNAKGRKQPDPVFLLDGRNRLAAMELVGLGTVDDGSLYIDPEIEFAVDAAGDRCIKQLYGHVDPYAYAISANIQRRHLTAEQKRDLIAKVLKAKPEASNRTIAKQVKADDKTVGKVRKELEATAEIPQLTKTTGQDGKSRPTKRKVAGQKEAYDKTFDPVEFMISGAMVTDPASPPEVSGPQTKQNIGKPDLQALAASWREVHAQISAGNLSRLRHALQSHRDKIDRALKTLPKGGAA
jgi:hypothetical protein